MIATSSIFFLLPSIISGGGISDNGSSFRVTTSYYNPSVNNSTLRRNALFPYSYVDSLKTKNDKFIGNDSDLISFIPRSVYSLCYYLFFRQFLKKLIYLPIIKICVVLKNVVVYIISLYYYYLFQ